MLIFGKPVTESTNDVPTYEGHVEPTLEGALEIVYESSKQMAEFSASLYVADVLAEQAVMEGASYEVVVEGVVKDSFAKLKKVFQDMWAKVKAWFANVKKLYRQLTLKGKDFVKEFRSEITTKARKVKDKGFKYKGYKYTPDALTSFVDSSVKVIDKYIHASSDDMETGASQLAKAQANAKAGVEYNAEEAIEKMWSELKAENSAELNKAVLERGRNGSDEKEVFEDFEGNSVEELINLVEEGAEIVKEMEKHEKKVDTQFNRILKALKTAESKATEAENKADGEAASKQAAAVTAYVSHHSRVSKQAISVGMSLLGTVTAYFREALSSSQSVLRQLLTFRVKGEKKDGVKEGFGEESILGAAMKSVF